MVDRDVVFAKLGSLSYCLKRIEDVRQPGRRLTDEDLEELLLLNLQRAAQAVVDLAAHVVATENLGLPERIADNFTRLEKAGILESELAENLRKMVGFRNIVVHAYEEIDSEVVERVIEHHLEDLRRFGARVKERFGL